MAASVSEHILARVAAVLAGTTSAGANVFRGRDDARAEGELPSLNIRRTATADETIGSNGGRITVGWDIDHDVAVSDGWETAVDALHVEVHARLHADTTLGVLGRGLRCTGTDVSMVSADHLYGRLTAHYQMQVFVRPGDLTRAIT